MNKKDVFKKEIETRINYLTRAIDQVRGYFECEKNQYMLGRYYGRLIAMEDERDSLIDILEVVEDYE